MITVENVKALSSRFLRSLLSGEPGVYITFVIRDNIDSTLIVNAYQAAINSGDILKYMQRIYPAVSSLDEPLIIVEPLQLASSRENESKSSSSSPSMNVIMGAAIGGGVGGLILIASLAWYYHSKSSKETDVVTKIATKPPPEIDSRRNYLHDHYKLPEETAVEENPVTINTISSSNVEIDDSVALLSNKSSWKSDPISAKSNRSEGPPVLMSDDISRHSMEAVEVDLAYK